MQRSEVALSTGLRYEVLSAGSGDRTLLLLHGYMDAAWGWLPIVETGRFSRFRIVAPSLRGHGGSGWIGEGATYYFLDYVADLASLIAIEQGGSGSSPGEAGRASPAPKRLCVVGHSMGGMVASYLAGTYPELYERVAILEGISIPEFPTSPERLRESIKGRNDVLPRRGSWAEPGTRRFASVEDAAARMRHHDPKLDPALALRLATHGCVRLPSGEYTFRYDPLLGPRMPYGFELSMAERFWAAITGDVLYLEGAESPWKLPEPERSRRLAMFKQARSVEQGTIANAGHMMLRHASEETARVIDEFLG
jgi:pimeloyl-ACP methyl ester carboxylesterase